MCIFFGFDLRFFLFFFCLFFIGYFPWFFARCPCVWLKKVAAGRLRVLPAALGECIEAKKKVAAGVAHLAKVFFTGRQG